MGERDAYAMEGYETWFVLAGIKYPEDAMLKDRLIQTFLQGLKGKARGVALKVTRREEAREEVLQAMRRDLNEVKEGDIKIL